MKVKMCANIINMTKGIRNESAGKRAKMIFCIFQAGATFPLKANIFVFLYLQIIEIQLNNSLI